MTTSADPRTLGQVFTDAKETRTDKVTFGAVRDYLRDELGITVTNQTVANYHHDAAGSTNPTVIAGIAAFYGLTLEHLPTWAGDACRKASRVLVLVGGTDAGRLVPGGAKQKDPGTSQTSRSRGNRTLSNRTGSGRHRGAGRAPVQPDFPPHNPEHPGYPIAN